MKVEINKKLEKKESLYPKIMINNDGLIVLFSNPRTGTILNNIKLYHNIGWSGLCFEPNEWKDFEGSITLSND